MTWECLLCRRTGYPLNYPARWRYRGRSSPAGCTTSHTPLRGRASLGEDCPHDSRYDRPPLWRGGLSTAGHPGPPVHLHRPRGHRRTRSRCRDRDVPRESSGWRCATRRSTRSKECARRWWPTGTLVAASSGWRPWTNSQQSPRSAIGPAPGLQQLAYRVTDVGQVSAILRQRGVRCSMTLPDAALATPGSTSSIPRTRVASWSSRLLAALSAKDGLRDVSAPARRPG